MTNEIQTERLTLVPLTVDHIEAFHAVWSDPDATKWSLHGRNATPEASRDWMRNILWTPANDKRHSFAVYVNNALEPSKCTGIVTLLPQSDPTKLDPVVCDTWELGYLYRPQYWGLGYATESCSAAIENLRKELAGVSTTGGLNLVANTDTGNEGSLKVLKKFGFEVVEHRKLGGPDRFLAGQWREDGYLILRRTL